MLRQTTEITNTHKSGFYISDCRIVFNHGKKKWIAGLGMKSRKHWLLSTKSTLSTLWKNWKFVMIPRQIGACRPGIPPCCLFLQIIHQINVTSGKNTITNVKVKVNKKIIKCFSATSLKKCTFWVNLFDDTLLETLQGSGMWSEQQSRKGRKQDWKKEGKQKICRRHDRAAWIPNPWNPK